MATKLIFPILVDLQEQILYWTDDTSLRQLAKTCHTVQQQINLIFQKRFAEKYEHSLLWKYKLPLPEFLFPHLQKYYPNYWENIGSAFLDRIAVVFNQIFLKEAATLPQIIKKIERKIGEQRAALKEICGEDPNDPHSSLNRAKKNHQIAREDARANEQLLEEEVRRNICYQQLELKQQQLEKSLARLTADLENVEKKILGNLLIDQYFYRNFDLVIDHLYSLISLEKLIELGRARSIENAFNAFQPEDLRSMILDVLYHHHKDQFIKEDWEREDYMHFLPEVKEIIHKLIKQARHFKTYYSQNLKEGIKIYSSNHPEVCQKALSFLQTHFSKETIKEPETDEEFATQAISLLTGLEKQCGSSFIEYIEFMHPKVTEKKLYITQPPQLSPEYVKNLDAVLKQFLEFTKFFLSPAQQTRNLRT